MLNGHFFSNTSVYLVLIFYAFTNSYGVTINLPSNKPTRANSKIEQSVWDDMVCKQKANTPSTLLMSSLISAGQATLHPQNK